MKLYRHYKGKSYGLIGTARHSETLEEFALYNCLYENELGRTWVRPKDMFFEPTRFTPVETKIRTVTEVSEWADLSTSILPTFQINEARERFNKFNPSLMLVASIDGRDVGFKAGYAVSPTEFYSYLGGVAPEFRGLGIASELMRSQHEWAVQQGFKVISTKTKNEFPQMLALNLRHGFRIVGVEERGDKPIKIVLRKLLSNQAS